MKQIVTPSNWPQRSINLKLVKWINIIQEECKGAFHADTVQSAFCSELCRAVKLKQLRIQRPVKKAIFMKFI